jgi:hypothetical protein
MIALACDGIDFVSLTPSTMGLDDAPNPFGLEVDEGADVVVLSSTFYHWLKTHRPDHVDSTLENVRRRGYRLVGLDGADDFALAFPPHVLSQLTVVLKGQGVYRDRDLYNYVVGPIYAGGVWAEKLRPRDERYRDADLERVKLSIPCYMLQLPDVQRVTRQRESASLQTMQRRMPAPERWVRNAADRALLQALPLIPSRHRNLDAHCLLKATHVQRIEIMTLLDRISGRRGITDIPHVILGTEYGWDLPPHAREQIVQNARLHMTKHLGRLRYLLDMQRHRMVIAPTGFGELTHRHGEALRAGAALVCQDLSHVDILLPLRDRENAIFCRPDLSDLRATVVELARDDQLRDRVSRAGFASYRSWAKGWRSHLRAGIETPLREAASGNA